MINPDELKFGDKLFYESYDYEIKLIFIKIDISKSKGTLSCINELGYIASYNSDYITLGWGEE